MAGWGNFLGTIANWFPKKEEFRRNKYEKLKKERKKILSKPDTPRNRSRLASIDKQLRSIENKAINQ